MKIKKLPNSKRVVVEFEEWLRPEPQEKHEVLVASIIMKMNELAQRRTSYSMWEFKTEEEARQALFMLGLKL